MSRLVRLVDNCSRALSMNRSRTSGCETFTDSPDCSSGLKLLRKLLLSVCVAVHDSPYDVPNHGSFWLRPAFDDTTSLWVAVGVRKPAGGRSWLLRCRLVLNVGLKAPAAAATRVSLICGSSRSARRSLL